MMKTEYIDKPDHRTGVLMRWRIISLLLLVSLVPLIILGSASSSLFGSQLSANALALLGNVVESRARAIEIFFLERQRALQLLAESKPSWTSADAGNLEHHLSVLNAVSRNAYTDLGVIDESGRHLAYAGPYRLQDKNYALTEWFETVMRHGTYISDVFQGFRQVPHCIIAVRTGPQEHPVILRATISSGHFDSLVNTWRLGSTGEAFIINSAGIYQTTPKAGKVLDSSGFSGFRPHGGSEEREISRGGKTLIQVSTWLNDNRWMLVAQQEKREVMAPVRSAVIGEMILISVSIFAIVLAAFLATGYLTRQIDNANDAREEMTRAFMRSAKLASIGELATGLAHEINNPLAIISAEQTNIRDLSEEMPVETGVRSAILESVSRCHRQVTRCAGITSKMLQFGRQKETSLERTALARHMADITDLLRRQAEVRNIKLSHETEAALPDVNVDPVELEQVLVNLIQNAFDALPEGGRIQVKARKLDGEVELSVRDDGTGIAAEVLEQIFEPFFTTKPVGKGTGLGLSVCYGIVSSWGGTIKAESTSGQGTKMSIRLPAL